MIANCMHYMVDVSRQEYAIAKRRRKSIKPALDVQLPKDVIDRRKKNDIAYWHVALFSVALKELRELLAEFVSVGFVRCS